MYNLGKNECKKIILLITYAILFYYFVTNFSSVLGVLSTTLGILSPFIIGFALAFILNKPFVFFRDKVLGKLADKNKKKERLGLRAGIAILLVYLLVIIFLVLIFSFVLPQFVKSISGLINYIPQYSKELFNTIDNMVDKVIINETMLKTIEKTSTSIASTMKTVLSNAVPAIVSFISNFASNVINIVIAVIVSIYLLFDKDHLKYQYRVIVRAFLSEKNANRVLRITELTSKTFSDFIGGQIIDAIIIGVLCSIGLAILNIPYALLIGTIVGFTNIIPYFGPWIGSIPSVFILFMVKPMYAIIFIIFVVILQQVDANIIYPNVVGSSVGLGALFVTFSIIVGGGLFGLVGMILGVPTFAVIYTLVKEKAYKNLKKKNITKV
ncbi:AI-2E family transporter [Anaerofustis stercorihominis]|uniref:AI-2E family transporter n=1 Tax=Anaerofustis stercorihominis TaxID=214853 RepID=UPI0011071463|nr:AI-2E family transporter [Anaerofustis stercorihominis]